MKMRILIAGVVSVVVLFAWTFVVNAIFGLGPSINMNQPTNMEEVYQVLTTNLMVPGGYVVHSAANQQGPTNDPVFSVRFSGLAHTDAGMTEILHIVWWLLTSWAVALLLSQANERILRSYLRRVLFIMTIGLVIAVASELRQYDIGGVPLKSVLLLTASCLISWSLVGLVMARIVRPRE